MSSLPHRIRQTRRSAGLSQAELATAVGVGRSAVAQWERKDGSRPSSSNLAKIAIAANAHFEWLATGRGMRQPLVGGETPALLVKYSAQCALEERLLVTFRHLGTRAQSSLLEVAELLASGK